MYSQPSKVSSSNIDVQELAKELAKHLGSNTVYINGSAPNSAEAEPQFGTNESIAKAMLSDSRMAGITSNIDSKVESKNVHVAKRRSDIADIINTIKGNS